MALKEPHVCDVLAMSQASIWRTPWYIFTLQFRGHSSFYSWRIKNCCTHTHSLSLSLSRNIHCLLQSHMSYQEGGDDPAFRNVIHMFNFYIISLPTYCMYHFKMVLLFLFTSVQLVADVIFGGWVVVCVCVCIYATWRYFHCLATCPYRLRSSALPPFSNVPFISD